MLLSAAVMLHAAPAPAATAGTTFLPQADSEVRSAEPNANLGSLAKLHADTDPAIRSYLRFDVSGLTGSIERATLKLYATSTTAAGVGVSATEATGWEERTVTWSTAPAMTGTSLYSGPLSSGNWAAIDVTSLVTTGGRLTLGLDATGPTAVAFASRESGMTAPQLIVETAAPPDEVDTQPNRPVRAAFYYPWFPEKWTYAGISPFSHFKPSGGYYDSSSNAIVQQHVRAMQYGGIQVGIASWGGVGSRTDARMSALLQTTDAMRSNFRWAIYYEPETSGDPTPDEIAADLQYLRARYGGDRSYYRIDGRPVVFVHGGTLDDCATAERWRQANADIAAFLVLRVFTGFRQCAARPDGWHQYGRAAADSQPGYAYTISPGYWRANESLPRVERDLGRFRQNVRDMIASKAPFQLVTTFNHWGDGTAVENAGQWATPSGYGGYLDALHDNGEPPGSPGPLPDGDPVLVAAGDIACDPTSTQFRGGAGVSTACRQRYTADLVRPDVAGVLALGDNQYNDNQLVKYQQAYDLSWGRFKDLIRPGIGNHEYLTPGAAGYFDYFDGVGNAGGPAGDRSRGYYSYDVGSWHVVSLNSNCSLIGGCGSGSPQERWLREDLAAHPSACTLAYWHHPRFSSGEHGSIPWTGAFWADLHAAGAEAVLSGHDHDYERFAPQDRSGAADPTGPRQFVVGTGGRSHYPFVATQPNSEVRDATSFGVLELTLHATSYEWRFVPEVGGSFTDSGSAACR